MARTRLPIKLSVDGEVVDAVTESVSAGAYVLVLSTTVPERWLPVDVHSTYVGHRDGETRVTHLALLPGVPGGRLTSELRPAASLPVGGEDRGACLYDHLQQLVAALRELGHAPSVAVGDDAVAVVSR